MKYLVHTMASSDPGDGDIIEFKTKADAYDHVRAMAEGGAHRCIVYLQQVGGSFPVYAPEDDVRGGRLRDAGRKRARNNPTDAENDAEFTRGMKEKSGFKRGSGCYKCQSCGKLTRSTGNSEEYTDNCFRCYEMGGENNQIMDTHRGPERDALIAGYNLRYPEAPFKE